MKLMIPGLSCPISFREEKIHSLIIENQHFLYNVLQDIYMQTNRYDGKCVFSVKETPQEMSKFTELLTDFISFDINKKSLLTKVISNLDNSAQDSSHFLQTQQLLSGISSYIYDLSFDLDFSITVEDFSFSQVLKACSLKIDSNSTTLAEKIFEYILLVRNLIGDKLFILVNLRGFINDEELQLFISTAAVHDIKILFIESVSRNLLKGENRITIDNDLCEF